MSILIINGRDEQEAQNYHRYTEKWKRALLENDPSLDIRIWPNIGDHNDIQLILVKRQPSNLLNQFPNLKCIVSMGSGVEHITSDFSAPKHIPIARLLDKNKATDITQYVIAIVLNLVKRLEHWRSCQAKSKWSKIPPFVLPNANVGVMGLGYLGLKITTTLSYLDLNVVSWTRTKRTLDNIKIFSGKNEFDAFLSQCNILICILPLTSETENILNKKTFSLLPHGAYVINIGRGKHLVEMDLLEALQTGQLSGACLDVFREEPLPSDHPFWTHPNITVTPHIASVTNPATVAPQIIENYQRAIEGLTLLNTVDVARGY